MLQSILFPLFVSCQVYYVFSILFEILFLLTLFSFVTFFPQKLIFGFLYFIFTLNLLLDILHPQVFYLWMISFTNSTCLTNAFLQYFVLLFYFSKQVSIGIGMWWIHYYRHFRQNMDILTRSTVDGFSSSWFLYLHVSKFLVLLFWVPASLGLQLSPPQK